MIDFPDWVEVTRCATRSFRLYMPTPHGRVFRAVMYDVGTLRSRPASSTR